MYLRTFSAILAGLLVASCGDEPTIVDIVSDDEAIECGIGPGADYAPVCELEWVDSEEGGANRAFLLNHPDGGFRRLELDPVTATLSAQDGAGEIVELPSAVDGVFEFSIDGDRYQITLSALLEEPQ